MDKPILYIDEWVSALLCKSCGTYLGTHVNRYWGKPCPSCAAVGTYCPPSIQTSRRFICTKKRWFKPDTGYYEWSGKVNGDKPIKPALMTGRVINSTPTLITATGIASGLF